MWTGQQILHEIDKALVTAQTDAELFDKTLSQLTYQLSENRREQTHACQSLAKLRLDEVKAKSVKDGLYRADTQARTLMRQRKSAMADNDAAMAEQTQQLNELESQRDQLMVVVDGKSQQLADQEAKAQAQLDSDEAYQSQLDIAREADAIADQAEEKLEQARRDSAEKRKPFEADALFMYLWRRQYGLPSYDSSGLIRRLDRWVASLCHYDQARVSYWTLQELPKRLAEHAEQVRVASNKELVTLQVLEKMAAQQQGATATQEQLQLEQAKVSDLDEKIEQAQQQLQALIDQKARFKSGQDTYYQQAIERLARALEIEPIAKLKQLSNRTHHLDDDQLVAALTDLQEEQRDLESDITEHRHRQQNKHERCSALQSIRQRFRRQQYDDYRSGFSNGDLIVSALSEFVSGSLAQDKLWHTIGRYQRYRDVGVWPDFGSGGLGLPSARRRNSNWYWPQGFRLPRSGGTPSRGRSNGSFRTGGGF